MDRNPRAGFLVVPAKDRNSLTLKNSRQPAGHEGENDEPNGMKGGMIWIGRLALLVLIWSFWASQHRKIISGIRLIAPQ